MEMGAATVSQRTDTPEAGTFGREPGGRVSGCVFPFQRTEEHHCHCQTPGNCVDDMGLC